MIFMRATGIVVEYNPFHNGHLYHLNKARKQTKADCIIAIMSGSFVQRGEPAMFDKWTRTKMALLGGADLVFELPVRFVMQQADIFATEAVRMLADLKAETIFFGSENGDSETFVEAAKLANQESFDTLIKEKLADKTLSYGAALTEALHEQIGDRIDVTLPNNILGFHYALANDKMNSPLNIQTLTRTTNYAELAPARPAVTSATAVRKMLLQGHFNEVKKYIPPFVYREIIGSAANLMTFAELYPLLRYRLLTDDPGTLSRINSVTEGIENRFVKAARHDEAGAFLNEIVTKRYSRARVQRTAMQILMRFEKQDKVSPYLRLLGMNQTGQAYLSHVKKDLELPLVTTISKAKEELIAYDVRATKLYSLMEGSLVTPESDFSKSPLIYW